MNKLEEIMAKMAECVEESKGGERADPHRVSDNLMSKLARALAERLDTETVEQVEKIIDLYNQVETWYE